MNNRPATPIRTSPSTRRRSHAPHTKELSATNNVISLPTRSLDLTLTVETSARGVRKQGDAIVGRAEAMREALGRQVEILRACVEAMR
jgi:hypothetical protein